MTAEKKQPRFSMEAKERVLNVISPVALLLVWQIFSGLGLIDPRFVPSPISIGIAGYDLIVSGELLGHVKDSLFRLLIGFVLGAIPAIMIGIVMGLSRWVRAAIDPIVAAFFPIPKIALLPIVMLLFGIGDVSKIVLIAFAVLFLVIINTMAGVMALDPVYFDVAKNFGASRYKLLTKVVIPGTLPFIFVGLRLGLGVSMIVIVAVEFVAAESGIGFLIWTSFAVMMIEDMFVGIIVITILGVLTNLVLRELERLAVPWRNEP
jgi:NitT/TauT family transport system permease protein